MTYRSLMHLLLCFTILTMSPLLKAACDPANIPPIVGDIGSIGQSNAITFWDGSSYDRDGDAYSCTVITQPANGVATGLENCDLYSARGTYKSNVGFVGTDSFTYQANDGCALSEIATVTIRVINPCVGSDCYSLDAIDTPSGFARAYQSGIDDDGNIAGRLSPYWLYYRSSITGEFTSLGFNGLGAAINNNNQFAGSFNGAFLDREAFIYDANLGSATLLGTLPGATNSAAVGMNNLGAVVGTSNAGEQKSGYFLNGETPYYWDPLTKIMIDIGDLPGGNTGGIATDVNDSGQVVGVSSSVFGTVHYSDFCACDIYLPEAFIWDELNGMRGLGDLPGGNFRSHASSINNKGEVVGYSSSAIGSQAFIWRPETEVMETLPGPSLGLDPFSAATDINEKSQVVGYGLAEWTTTSGEPFVWDEVNGRRALSLLLDSSAAGWLLHSFPNNTGVYLNNHGQIITSALGPDGLESIVVLSPAGFVPGGDACTTQNPISKVTTAGGGQSMSVNEQVQVTFIGRMTTTAGLITGGKNSVKICPGTTVDYAVSGAVSCLVNNNTTGITGTLHIGDKLICTSQPNGNDVDRFSVKSGI